MFTIDWFLSMVALVSGFVLGLRTITQEDKIFGKAREILMAYTDYYDPVTKETERVYHYPDWFHKPLLTCVACMPSIWGLIVILVATNMFWQWNIVTVFDYLKLFTSIAFISVTSSFITETLWFIKKSNRPD